MRKTIMPLLIGLVCIAFFSSCFVYIATQGVKLGPIVIKPISKNLTVKKDLKILAIGNSFNQDVMAYLPPVLNELLPDYKITYATLYKGSAKIEEHVSMFHNNDKYTYYNCWEEDATAWKRYRNKYSLADILSEKWDIIMFQGTSSDVYSDKLIQNKLIVPGRQLLRILQNNTKKPFAAMWVQWIGRPQGEKTSTEMTDLIVSATTEVMNNLGMQDFIPVGIALQSARTVPALQMLGEGSDMLYRDHVHLQAGLPALLAAYTIALKITEWTGNYHVGVYRSHFVPTDKRCIEIGVRAEDPSIIMMTHGSSVGITPENIRVIQEIATMAVKRPATVTNCDSFFNLDRSQTIKSRK